MTSLPKIGSATATASFDSRARDIAANGGAVWIIGTDNGIYRLQGNNWM